MKLATKYSSALHKNKPFLRSEGGRYDFWGFDDGSRAMPGDIPANIPLNMWAPPEGTNYKNWRLKLAQYGKAFSQSFSIRSVSPSRPMSFGLEIGNRREPSNKLEYGYFASAIFTNDFVFQLVDIKRFAIANNNLIPTIQLKNSRSDYSTNLAVNFSGGLKLRRKHKLKLYHFYTHSSHDVVIFSTGITPNVDRGVFIKQYYVEKSIRNLTLIG
jgi:hypothetical protein